VDEATYPLKSEKYGTTAVQPDRWGGVPLSPSMQAHMPTIEREPPKPKRAYVHRLKCTVCGRKFESRRACAVHKRMAHRDKPLPTNIGDIMKAQEVPPEGLQCPHCEAVFSNRFALSAHMEIHKP
jgi:uncharacterized C2H2 Zn-finger protein